MIWQDILFEKCVPKGDVVEALADVFNVDTHQVCMCGDLEEVLSLGEKLCKLICVYTDVRGDFSSMLSVYLLDDRLSAEVAAFSDTLSFMKKLCCRMQTKCAFPDATDVPLRMLEVSESGNFSSISLEESQDGGIMEYRVISRAEVKS